MMVLIKQLLKMFSRGSIFCAAFWWRQTPINKCFLCFEKCVFPCFCLDWFYLHLKHTNECMLGHKQPQEKQNQKQYRNYLLLCIYFTRGRYWITSYLWSKYFHFNWVIQKHEVTEGWKLLWVCISRCALIQFFLCRTLLNFF